MSPVIALSILALTVSVAIGRPRLGRLQIGHVEAALFGALLALLTGVVSVPQALKAVGDLAMPITTIISLMTITLIADRCGLLNMAAHQVATAARGSGRRLFAYIFAAGAATGTVFTNDAAILILTPVVFRLMEAVQEEDWTLANKTPFYFAVLYVGNLVGALIISNPINIVVGSFFDIRFLDYAAWMALPALVSMVASFAGLWYFFRDSIPISYRMPARPEQRSVEPDMARVSAVIIGLILIGFFSESMTGLPVWLVALAGAVAALIIYSWKGYFFRGILWEVGWDVILFVIGIFIIVVGLRNQGIAQLIGDLVARLGGDTLSGLTFATGFVAAVCSAIFNNHPTAGLMIWVVQDFEMPALATKMLVFAALIGGDLGPKMLPIGSLAALMWFRILRARGVAVSYRLYIRIGVPVTLGAVGLSLWVLNLQWIAYNWLSN